MLHRIQVLYSTVLSSPRYELCRYVQVDDKYICTATNLRSAAGTRPSPQHPNRRRARPAVCRAVSNPSQRQSGLPVNCFFTSLPWLPSLLQDEARPSQGVLPSTYIWKNVARSIHQWRQSDFLGFFFHSGRLAFYCADARASNPCFHHLATPPPRLQVTRPRPTAVCGYQVSLSTLIPAQTTCCLSS